MTEPLKPGASIEPLAVDGRGAGGMFCLGRSTWAKLVSAGRVPRPRRLGRRVLWDTGELREWWAAGAPSCETWEAMKSAARARAGARS